MKATGNAAPVWWGRFVMLPHRKPAPRRQCSSCAGGGEINGVPCRDCSQRGYHDAGGEQGQGSRPDRSSTSANDDY